MIPIFQRQVGALFGEIDEVAYHPLISLLRTRNGNEGRGHSANNRRLQDFVRQSDEVSNLINIFNKNQMCKRGVIKWNF